MSEQNTATPNQISTVNRRDWLKRATAVAGGTALGVTLPSASEAAASSAQTAPAPGTRIATPNDIVETTAGRVRGFTRNGVHIFRGMPYGDTTAGANRFMPAKKPTPWTGVRSSTSWGPCCPQAARGGWVNDEEQFLYQWDDGFPGEDMLRVNVWTPAVNDNGRRPVLVWIHGGGFQSGSSQELRPYDGENLAKRHNAVLVSMNHRLNVFGFLDLSNVGGSAYAQSVNLGQLDLVLALEWVRDNIARFGGDPGNVMIFGQSGGARKVSTLLAMPAARGLFHRAAVLSGSHLRQNTPEQTERQARAVLTQLNITGSDLKRLHEVPTATLMAAAIEAQRSLSPTVGWGPVVDGTILPAHAFDPVAPAISAGVPLLVGNTFAEFGGGMGNPTAHELTFDGLRERLQPTLGARTDDAIAAYRKTFPSARPFEISALVTGTRAYRLGAVTMADLKSVQTAPVYMYWFGWNTPVLDGRPLAYHCQDLAFWFDNIDLAAQATGGTEDARDLASKMSAALVAFTKTGDPNHAGLPTWPRFNPTERPTMVFENERVSVKNDPDKDARALVG
jgi:para-nitrobenzyl esterase